MSAAVGAAFGGELSVHVMAEVISRGDDDNLIPATGMDGGRDLRGRRGLAGGRELRFAVGAKPSLDDLEPVEHVGRDLDQVAEDGASAGEVEVGVVGQAHIVHEVGELGLLERVGRGLRAVQHARLQRRVGLAPGGRRRTDRGIAAP